MCILYLIEELRDAYTDNSGKKYIVTGVRQHSSLQKNPSSHYVTVSGQQFCMGSVRAKQ